jgi:hypothetical protein
MEIHFMLGTFQGRPVRRRHKNYRLGVPLDST